MPHITTDDGVKLQWEETGAGDPILFLHEFGGHPLSWEPQIRHFSRRYRCITYAARGWPPSDIPDAASPIRKPAPPTTRRRCCMASASPRRIWSACRWARPRRSSSASAIPIWRCR
ncbi:MAG: alpha/beta hydrolase [Pseudomonadota bacterium]